VFEVFKNPIISLVSFVVGYGAAEFRDWRKTKRRTKNMLRMLRVELLENLANIKAIESSLKKTGLTQLASLAPLSAKFHSYVDRLSTKVFDAHLVDLANASENQLEAIFEAYNSCKHVMNCDWLGDVESTEVSGPRLGDVQKRIEMALSLLEETVDGRRNIQNNPKTETHS